MFENGNETHNMIRTKKNSKTLNLIKNEHIIHYKIYNLYLESSTEEFQKKCILLLGTLHIKENLI